MLFLGLSFFEGGGGMDDGAGGWGRDEIRFVSVSFSNKLEKIKHRLFTFF